MIQKSLFTTLFIKLIVFPGVTHMTCMQLKSVIYQMELWENQLNLKVIINNTDYY